MEEQEPSVEERVRKALSPMSVEEIVKVLALPSSERWGWLWKNAEYVYGFEADAALQRVANEKVRESVGKSGGKCVCFKDVHIEASEWGPGYDYRDYFPLARPPLRDAPGKMCGRCGGNVPWRQDCGYCGRAVYRSGPGGWTQPNRCVGCQKRSVFRRDIRGDVCTCEPLPGFKPRRKRPA